MKNIGLKANLDNLLKIRDHHWSAFLVVTSSTTVYTLNIEKFNFVELTIVIAGFFFSLFLWALYKSMNTDIINNIKELSND